MNQHLTRLVEARLYYFARVGAILAERHFDRPNCLLELRANPPKVEDDE